MKNPEKTLKYQCNRIRKHMRILIQEVEELENVQEDEDAYHIMYHIRCIYEAMETAREAGEAAGDNEYGEYALDAYEATAQAIRQAKGRLQTDE